MGFFDDLDVASGDLIYDGLPADTYAMIVSNAEVKLSSRGTMRGLGITYTVIAGKHKGRTYYEWKRRPHKDDIDVQTDEQRQKSIDHLKTRMINFGVPESKINEVGPEDIIGTEVIVKFYMSKNKETKEESLRISSVMPGTFTDDDLASMPGNTSSVKKNVFE